MKVNKIIYVVALSIVVLSCKKEAGLSPEKVSSEYTLPQGNHVYDARIVDFHAKYGTYILYKFNSNDFRWNITNQIVYVADQGDEDWVAPSLDFLDDHLYSFYDPSIVKKMLPYKIILSSRIRKLSSISTDADTISTPVASTYAYSHFAFGFCSNKLNAMNASEISDAKAQLHQSLWASAIQGGRIEISPAFTTATNYAYVSNYNKAQYGIFNIGITGINANLDFTDYIYVITSTTKAELENSVFLPVNDPSGKFRLKYNLIINYYKTNYQIDLQAIGDAK